MRIANETGKPCFHAIDKRFVSVRHATIVTEPAMSCSVAALTQGKIAIHHGENIVVVLCGANVALENIRNRVDRNPPRG